MFSSRIEFYTPDRTRLLLRLLAAITIIGVAARQIPDLLAGKPIVDGDFASFYVGSWLAVHAPERLYDIGLNTVLQNRLWPHFHGESVTFFYPPAYAAILRPLCYFTPNAARELFFLIHLFFFFAACIVLYQLRTERDPAYSAPGSTLSQFDLIWILFLFYPNLACLFGGQNSSFSLLLYVLVLYYVRRGDRRSELLGGIACGLWLIKPNYPALILVGMLFAKKWRFIFGAALSAIALYFFGAFQAGWLWPVDWLKSISSLTAVEVYGNSYRYNSIGGVMTGVAVWLGHYSLVPKLRIVAGVVTILAAIWCAVRFGRARTSEQLFRLLVLVGPISLLISPHSFFYDTVLCIPTGLLWLKTRSDREISTIAALFLLVFNFANNIQGFPVNPLILMVLAAALIGVRKNEPIPRQS